MSKLAELRGRMNAASTELETLWKKDERSDDDDARLDSLLAEINDIGPKMEREARIESAAKAAQKNGESRGRVAGTLPTEGAEEAERNVRKMDRRSIGARFADSEQVRNYLPHANIKGTQSDPFHVGSFYHRHQVQHTADMTPDELRAIITTGNLPADYITPTQVPGFFRGDDLQGSLRDVLVNGTTQSDAIVFFRELAFTNNAAGVPQATHTAAASETPASASVKPESAITFEQDIAPVVTIAHWIPITRQTLSDAGQIRTYVEQRLMDGLRGEESDQLLNGAGTNDLEGLLGTTGVQDLNATYFTGAPTSDAGTDNENFNRIRRAKTLIRTVGRAIPNFVVINPADLEQFDTATDANEQYFGTGPYGGANPARLWGLRVVEDEHIAENTALVGDGRMAAVWDREQANILTGYIDNQFVRNMLTILAEERLALTVFRPAAFAEVALVA
jgi:HK97 family phage major capsid protein